MSHPPPHVAPIAFSDYLALSRDRRRWPASLRLAAASAVMIVGVLLVYGPVRYWNDVRSHVALLLPLCAIPALLVLVELAVDHGLYRWHYRRQRNAGRPVTFAFGAEALDWSVGDMSGRIAWTAVRRLRDDGSRLYVHVDPVTAVGVPRGNLDDAAWAERVRIARTGAGIPA